MALWQFITFTALLGALLVYAGVITRRLGCADARLNRIEEALLAKSGSIESADTRATEARPEVASRASQANPEVATRANEANPEVSSGKEGRRGYLTIHDLRARSEQLNSRAARSSSRNSVAVPERRDALKAMRGLMESPGTTPEGNSVVISSESREAPATSSELVNPPTMGAVNGDFEAAVSLESREAPATSSEPLNLPTMGAVNGDSEAASLESRDAPATNSEPVNLPTMEVANGDSEAASLESRDASATNSDRQSPPRHRPVSDDSVAKKNRDIAVFLSNQRRRRRARLGY